MRTLVARRRNRCGGPITLAGAQLASKKPKVVLTACMRKLLVMLKAAVRDQVPWNPELAAIARDLPSPFSAACASGGAVIMAGTICTA
jgi:hypothetical protein